MTHTLPITIYYEDTDAQGVVYYANYLRYFERARTEYLREIGHGQKKLMDKGAIFIVRKISIEFLKPAADCRICIIVPIRSSACVLLTPKFFID